ncbi:MAG: DUF111 family protein, partial [Desulfofustis sp.]|nr:DUF111 family protein [Desulfofustis sp.]
MVQAANTVYLDCFSGISGDMLLGALLDIGVSEEALRGELNKLGLEPFTFKVTRQTRQSIGALSVQITSESDQQFRNLATISDLLEQSSLDPAITERALKVFRRLAQAEAKVHGKPVDEIHFHEVGALDTIIDIVGVIAGLHLLGITSI